ncbi:MAG: hypothetical protein WCL61_00585 [bacterium]
MRAIRNGSCVLNACWGSYFASEEGQALLLLLLRRRKMDNKPITIWFDDPVVEGISGHCGFGLMRRLVNAKADQWAWEKVACCMDGSITADGRGDYYGVVMVVEPH